MFFFRKKRRAEETVAAYIPGDRELRLEKRTKLVFFGWTVFLFLVFLCAALFFFKAPFFRIEEIEIVGNKLVPRDAILALALSGASSSRLSAAIFGIDHFFSWPETFSPEKLRFLPMLKSALVEKNYRNRSVAINVVEREPYGIWCNAFSPDSEESARCWWFDDEGVIFRRAVRAEGSLISSVADYSQNGLGLAAKILPEKFLLNLFSVLETVKVSGLKVREIVLEDIGLQELAVKTYDGPELYFSLRFPAESALAAISALALKSGFKDLEYLDFRVENRIYYR